VSSAENAGQTASRGVSSFREEEFLTPSLSSSGVELEAGGDQEVSTSLRLESSESPSFLSFNIVLSPLLSAIYPYRILLVL